ncbi:piercer of microtubule wall 1 protein-like isoform X1 [Corticium candelabrum]|uniref:piercer of microtubule wall 1 protein-like isoform X1 n=1 Tax=Corticium candelabrum TaxID=121492 RepID=UPI002E26CE96|nr:piercer of microtubule wall 1 protein-like isoform X1 [Corticium candelabrum]
MADSTGTTCHLEPRQGQRTSDTYRTHNLPERFDKPVLSGNPVFTCEPNVKREKRGDCFQGYNTKQEHPMYRTSTSTYGGVSPTVHTVPTSWHGKSQKFTEHLGLSGMYRNHSLNTSTDKSKV